MFDSAQDLASALHRVALGDRTAFESLYQATSAKLYGIIVRMVVNRSAADELLQEVYVKIWQKAEEFDVSRASPITWMAAIARNRAIDELRRTKPRLSTSMEDADDIAADLPHPLEGQERSDQLKALIACLNALPEERRKIILLAYYRGLSREELASRFGRPVPTIKTWIHRSLAQLKLCLAS